MPSPPWARWRVASNCENISKIVAEFLARNARPIIANADDGAIVIATGGDPNRCRRGRCIWRHCATGSKTPASAGPRLPRRSVAQRATRREVDASRSDKIGCVDSMVWVTSRVRSTRSVLQFDASFGDPRDVHQIVDEPRHLTHLADHQRANPIEHRAIVSPAGQQLQSIAERRQRIAQLVRQAWPKTGPYGDPLVRPCRATSGFARPRLRPGLATAAAPRSDRSQIADTKIKVNRLTQSTRVSERETRTCRWAELKTQFAAR